MLLPPPPSSSLLLLLLLLLLHALPPPPPDSITPHSSAPLCPCGPHSTAAAAAVTARIKVPGDGRELVVALPDAVKVAAEDGRRVEAVDLSPYIDHLPGGIRTAAFRSDDASGSTSQAAAIQVCALRSAL